MITIICPGRKVEPERTNPERLDDILRSLEIAYAASIDALGKI